jgi:hypothetical protein
MYTGTLIDELIATVEQVELNAHIVRERPEPSEPMWYGALSENATNPNLVGVA